MSVLIVYAGPPLSWETTAHCALAPTAHTRPTIYRNSWRTQFRPWEPWPGWLSHMTSTHLCQPWAAMLCIPCRNPSSPPTESNAPSQFLPFHDSPVCTPQILTPYSSCTPQPPHPVAHCMATLLSLLMLQQPVHGEYLHGCFSYPAKTPPHSPSHECLPWFVQANSFMNCS